MFCSQKVSRNHCFTVLLQQARFCIRLQTSFAAIFLTLGVLITRRSRAEWAFHRPFSSSAPCSNTTPASHPWWNNYEGREYSTDDWDKTQNTITVISMHNFWMQGTTLPGGGGGGVLGYKRDGGPTEPNILHPKKYMDLILSTQKNTRLEIILSDLEATLAWIG